MVVAGVKGSAVIGGRRKVDIAAGAAHPGHAVAGAADGLFRVGGGTGKQFLLKAPDAAVDDIGDGGLNLHAAHVTEIAPGAANRLAVKLERKHVADGLPADQRVLVDV